MKALTRFSMVMISFVIFSGLSLAQHRGHGNPPGGHHQCPPREQHLLMGLADQLTEDQLQTLRETIREMRSNGATREEIHTAVTTLLESWGVEICENWGLHPRGDRHFFGRIWDQLSDDQRATLRETIHTMKSNDATREEIHTAITDLLEGWGIELPENWGYHRHGNRHFNGEIWTQLNDDQKAILRHTIREMRSNGATREEIREAVDALLAEWGFSPGQEGTFPNRNGVIDEAFNRPNPFNPDTEITYRLKNDSRVTVSIFDMNGREIKVLQDQYQPAGSYTHYWDGTDANGKQMSTGIYFFRIRAGNDTVTNRMMLIK